ncbi:MAG TPA: hypothetical protein VF765_16985 [Polyangiaceae bacterium]
MPELRRVALAVGMALALAVSGHARAQDEGEDDMPPGHPSVDDNPHGQAGGGQGAGAMPGVFQPKQDTEQEDPSLPEGTIAVDLRDADEKPVPGEQVTLGILVNSVAKGDSRQHTQATTDASGRAVFPNLERASHIAYRVSVGYQGGLFAAMPFQMQQVKAMHVVLHVYPVTHDIQKALIVAEATVATELRDDRVQVEEVLTLYNLGPTAWQPLDLDMKLPEGATAFSAQQSMTDQGADEMGGKARLRGTFPPGKHTVDFRWQLPWSGDRDVDFAVDMPPHVAIARVMLAATSDIKLAVDGFPAAELRRNEEGQSFLVTERRLRPDEPKLTTLALGIHDLPTPGPGRVVAALLALAAIVTGLVMAFRQSGPGAGPGATSKRDRKAILEELAELERGRASGDVGPKTYERAYRTLIDALARTLAES